MSRLLRTAPLLFEALPALARTVPWTPLAHVPTEVEPCTPLREWLGPACERVFMKRDDLISPLYGGNKVRRYEYVLADARARGATRIVTAGGIASTQVTATALFGRELGFRVTAVLFDQPVTPFARTQLKGFADSGADLVYGGGYVRTAWSTWRALSKEPSSYLILPGAPHPLANLGYVDAMLELAGQVARGEASRPDLIVLPTGSSGTLAALALGCAHLGWSTEVIGVRITSAFACNRATIRVIAGATDRFLAARDKGWRPMRGRLRYSLYGAALGPGYGFATPEAEVGVKMVEALTGAPGEVTYSGKALAALRVIAKDPRHEGKTILLWNTLSTARPMLSPDASAKVPAELQWVLDSAPERVTGRREGAK